MRPQRAIFCTAALDTPSASARRCIDQPSFNSSATTARRCAASVSWRTRVAARRRVSRLAARTRWSVAKEGQRPAEFGLVLPDLTEQSTRPSETDLAVFVAGVAETAEVGGVRITATGPAEATGRRGRVLGCRHATTVHLRYTEVKP